ncbi:hypothetical protein OSTOST_04276 [Ostertagia ostertagi]
MTSDRAKDLRTDPGAPAYNPDGGFRNSVVQQLLRSSSSSTDVQPPPATSSRFLGQREGQLNALFTSSTRGASSTMFMCAEGARKEVYIIRSRSKAFHKVRGMTWDNIPESFSRLHDGTRFLQLKTAQVQIYCSRRTIEKAYRNGLHALVADGVHQILPEQLGDHSQLYTIHGVCNNGVEVPLFHALTRNKTETTYRMIFGYIEGEFVALGGVPSLRLIVDFETAAINAAKATIPSMTVEGCGFHLAQAWNRKRDSLGLRRYLKGPHKSRAVLKWWRTIKGLPFLPKHLHRRVPGLKLRRILKKKNVDLEVILRRVRAANTRAFADLCALEQVPDRERNLRTRDLERRRKVAREMRRFARELNGAYILTSTIIKYCRRMSRYISEKTI